MISLVEPAVFSGPVASVRVLGNRVMLLRIEDAATRSGLIVPDHWQHGSVLHTVLEVGPGGWVWNKKKTKRHWVTPLVELGDTVVSFHASRASEHPDWKEPIYLDTADGRGRVVLDSRFIELKYKT